ncbi:MAG: hypothetical protein ACLGJA_26500, partial [Gammaproteobacteria bacterium]
MSPLNRVVFAVCAGLSLLLSAQSVDASAIYGINLRIAKEVNSIALLTYLNSAETMAERQHLKAAGRAKVSQLFPPPLGERNHLVEGARGNVDEHRNSQKPEGLLRALFDDQV